MIFLNQRLFSSDHYTIDFFRSPCPNHRVVVTFTEFTSRDLEGLGFGGRFLLNNGFDVVAVKSDVDRWYQDLAPGAIQAVNDFLDHRPERHISRVGYGSSMGGYAVFLFAGALDLDVAFAISPQFDITLDIDTRWAKHIEGEMRTLAPADVGRQCQYVAMFDPMDADRCHIDLFRAVIPSEQFHTIGVRYSGHPAGHTLIYSGVLKDIAAGVLSGKIPPLPYGDIVKGARKSPLYLFRLAQVCHARKRLAAATSLITSAIEKQALNAESYILAAKIASESGDLNLALQRAAAAVALKPEHPHMVAFLADVLVRCQKYSAAIHYYDRALSMVHVSAWARHRDELVNALSA